PPGPADAGGGPAGSEPAGLAFEPSGPVFAAMPWRWVGALFALFGVAPALPGQQGPGYAGTATFTTFRLRPAGR
ncbi:hypothetical protein ACWCPH_32105, partial [Streptomyces zhihengii]